MDKLNTKNFCDLVHNLNINAFCKVEMIASLNNDFGLKREALETFKRDMKAINSDIKVKGVLEFLITDDESFSYRNQSVLTPLMNTSEIERKKIFEILGNPSVKNDDKYRRCIKILSSPTKNSIPKAQPLLRQRTDSISSHSAIKVA